MKPSIMGLSVETSASPESSVNPRDACAVAPACVPRYLQLGSVLEGVSELLWRVMGVRLEVGPAPHSESWARHVLKATAWHPDVGHMGVIYLDLLSR